RVRASPPARSRPPVPRTARLRPRRPVRDRLRSRLGMPRSGRWDGDATVLAVLVLILVVVGLVMSLSASFVDAAEGGDPFGIFARQAAWAAVGVPAFFVIAATHHRVWRPLSWLLLAASLAGLALVLVPGIGLSEGGSARWIALGPFALQPSELAKLATVLWLADVYTRKRELGLPVDRDLGHLLVPALPLLGLEATLVMLEPDLGTTLLLGLVVGLVLWSEGIGLRPLAALGTAGVLFTGAAAILEPYRFARLTAWWEPTADPLGNGYQLLQARYALASGGWFGLGLGSSRGKWNFVPNPETDFIFAIIGEELGLVGAVAVLLLFAALLLVGLRVARRATDRFGRVVAFAVTGWIVGQALVNAGAVTGLLPITGVTLPLVSVGGSSLLSTLVALGTLVAVARSTPPANGRRRPEAVG
ncbi:MAG TPA: putative lipid II flippase FtsW, partial [Nitriliruptorales bacterium]|nr:putative lipid II flippase FtsW [Nitriliruptorales bacterium]